MGSLSPAHRICDTELEVKTASPSLIRDNVTVCRQYVPQLCHKSSSNLLHTSMNKLFAAQSLSMSLSTIELTCSSVASSIKISSRSVLRQFFCAYTE